MTFRWRDAHWKTGRSNFRDMIELAFSARKLVRIGEHRLPACSSRQLAEAFLIYKFATRNCFRQAAGKCRLAACAPQTQNAPHGCGTVGRRLLAAGRVRGLSGKIVSARRRNQHARRALPGNLRSAGIVTDAHRSHSAVVSQVMKSSSDSRVRATAKATTVASSRKPRKGTSSGIRSNGSTR